MDQAEQVPAHEPPLPEQRFVCCGDCRHCDPDFYEADGECGEECHPGTKCDDA